MTIATRLEELLDASDVRYEVIDHAPAFTAQEEAAAAHVPGRCWAKTVEVMLDGRPAICVIPATRRLDLDRLREVSGAERVELATEGELGSLFPDCDLGAMPPFGNLYGQTTFVDERLRESERIAVHAGDHRSAIEMADAEYESLAEPVPGRISTAPRETA